MSEHYIVVAGNQVIHRSKTREGAEHWLKRFGHTLTAEQLERLPEKRWIIKKEGEL